ncbi:MAG: winged helix-turn-helix domain-containing protein [Patescibacteria group bacterium]|jgi:DNA-binding winged helix-turn-helix (wHTH) protein
MSLQIDHILTPKTEKHFFQEQLLPPLLRGECVSVFWVPHGGIRTKMTFFVENVDYFGLGKIGKYKIVYVNPYEMIEITPTGYFRLIFGSSSFKDLRDKMTNLLKSNFHVILLLGEFSKVNFSSAFYNNLLCLHQLDRRRVHYVFNFTRDVLSIEEVKKYDQLLPVIEQNKIYFPLSDEKDSAFILEKFIKQFGYQISLSQKLLIMELAGGHPSLMRSCLQTINKDPFLQKDEAILRMSRQTEVEIILEDIWESCSDEEKKSLSQLVNNSLQKNSNIPYSLRRNKILQLKEGQVLPFSPLFANFISKKQVKRQIAFNENSGQILVDGSPVTKEITFCEQQFLKAFLESPNKVITRDMLAEAIWGEDSYEKYSDWAIDRLTYRLRKKLEQWDICPSSIQTVKGRGYRWLSS